MSRMYKAQNAMGKKPTRQNRPHVNRPERQHAKTRPTKFGTIPRNRSAQTRLERTNMTLQRTGTEPAACKGQVHNDTQGTRINHGTSS